MKDDTFSRARMLMNFLETELFLRQEKQHPVPRLAQQEPSPSSLLGLAFVVRLRL